MFCSHTSLSLYPNGIRTSVHLKRCTCNKKKSQNALMEKWASCADTACELYMWEASNMLSCRKKRNDSGITHMECIINGRGISSLNYFRISISISCKN